MDDHTHHTSSRAAVVKRMRGLFSASYKLTGGRVGARDDLENLLRDARLTNAIVAARERLLEVFGVVGGRLHGLHARRQLRGDRLLKRAEDLSVEVEREDGVEDLDGVLLEDGVFGEHLGLRRFEERRLDRQVAVLGREFEDLVALGLDARGREREHGAHGRRRRDERHEFGVDELDLVGLAVEELVQHLARDHRGEVGARHLRARVRAAIERHAAALVEGLQLGADGHDLDLDARVLELSFPLLDLLDDVRVVRPAEPAVAADGEERHALDVARLENGQVERLLAELLDQAGEDRLERF
mmetsp:Transcript_11994/g.48274  ORF Transcript_11994/g.48274 Transcript_11994/m.48274 type:complete len:300 (+) Transcript_11994:430-1329(+)